MESEEIIREKIKKFIEILDKEKGDYHKFENKVWTNVSKYIKENHTEVKGIPSVLFVIELLLKDLNAWNDDLRTDIKWIQSR